MKVLLADDDVELVDWLGYALHRSGYTILKAYHGDAAMRLFEQEAPDVVVLDLVMPRRTGMQVLEEIRRRSQAPVIMLTGVNDEDKAVQALRGGADDYVTKPFRPRELMARIEAVTRRQRAAQGQVEFHNPLACGEIRLEPRSRSVSVADRPVHLTPTEFGLLEFLMLNQGAVLSLSDILNRVWGYDAEQNEHVVRVTVSRLRQKIEQDPARPRYIHNMPGEGYVMEDRG